MAESRPQMKATTVESAQLQERTQRIISSVTLVALACLFTHHFLGAKAALITGLLLGALGYALHQSTITSYSFWTFAAITAGVLLIQNVVGYFGMPALLLLLAPVALMTGFVWLTSTND